MQKWSVLRPLIYIKNQPAALHRELKVKVLVSQSVVSDSFSDPVDCSPPGSSVHGILQARILEWVAIPFSRGSS